MLPSLKCVTTALVLWCLSQNFRRPIQYGVGHQECGYSHLALPAVISNTNALQATAPRCLTSILSPVASLFSPTPLWYGTLKIFVFLNTAHIVASILDHRINGPGSCYKTGSTQAHEVGFFCVIFFSLTMDMSGVQWCWCFKLTNP